jgi:hypothetical protein
MADTKISALTDGVTANATDTIPAARAGANVRVTPAYIKDYILGLANSWTNTQTVSLSANTTAIAVTGYSLTGSNAQSMIDLAGTWNTSGTPSAFTLTMTDTASNAASALFDFRVGSDSVLKLIKTNELRWFSGANHTSISGDGFYTYFKQAGNTKASIDNAGNFGCSGNISVRGGDAPPNNGALDRCITVSSTANFGFFWGVGAPDKSAAKGSLYLRTDGGGTSDRLYVATNSSGAWTAITTAG